MEGCCCNIFLDVTQCMPYFLPFLMWLYFTLGRSLKAEVTAESLEGAKGTGTLLPRLTYLCCFPQGNLCQCPLRKFHGSKVATSFLISLVTHFQFVNLGKVYPVLPSSSLSPFVRRSDICMQTGRHREQPCVQCKRTPVTLSPFSSL